MISKKGEDGPNELAYSHSDIDYPFPVILNIGNRNPVGLFGDLLNCAAIDIEGGILYIHQSICEYPNKKIEPFFFCQILKRQQV